MTHIALDRRWMSRKFMTTLIASDGTCPHSTGKSGQQSTRPVQHSREGKKVEDMGEKLMGDCRKNWAAREVRRKYRLLDFEFGSSV